MRLGLHVSILLLIQSFAFGKVPLKEMVSQMIMVGFNGQKIDDKWVNQIRLDIKFKRLGGILFLERNIASKEQFTTLVGDLKKIKSPLPTFLAMIQEGGSASILTKDKGFNEFPSPKAIVDTLTLDKAKDINSRMASQLKDIGINLNLAPIENSCHDYGSLGKRRCFSKYSSIVTSYSLDFIDSFDEKKILTCMKYFPAYTNKKIDISDKWDFEELRPYYNIIRAQKAKSIMVSHAYLKRFDSENIASMSKKIIEKILRGQLKYNGVVISENMMKRSISGIPLRDRVIKSVNAGVDILLFSEYFVENSNTPKVVRNIILNAVSKGLISKRRIEEAYNRIKSLKEEIK